MLSLCPSILPSESLQDLFEVLLGLPRPSEVLLLSLLKLPEALRDSLMPFVAPREALRPSVAL